MIYDIHTHHESAENAVFNLILKNGQEILPQQFCSVGIHPWYACDFNENMAQILRKYAEQPNVLAVGESGIDKLRGGDMDEQIKWLEYHIRLSEELGKPLIIHDVKGIDTILALKKKYKPQQAWVRHGFRGNEQMAKSLIDNGFYISLGEKWNEKAVKFIPSERLLLETDESLMSIEEIAERIATVRGTDKKEILALSAENIARIIPTIK